MLRSTFRLATPKLATPFTIRATAQAARKSTLFCSGATAGGFYFSTAATATSVALCDDGKQEKKEVDLFDEAQEASDKAAVREYIANRSWGQAIMDVIKVFAAAGYFAYALFYKLVFRGALLKENKSVLTGLGLIGIYFTIADAVWRFVMTEKQKELAYAQGREQRRAAIREEEKKREAEAKQKAN